MFTWLSHPSCIRIRRRTMLISLVNMTLHYAALSPLNCHLHKWISDTKIAHTLMTTGAPVSSAHVSVLNKELCLFLVSLFQWLPSQQTAKDYLLLWEVQWFMTVFLLLYMSSLLMYCLVSVWLLQWAECKYNYWLWMLQPFFKKYLMIYLSNT